MAWRIISAMNWLIRMMPMSLRAKKLLEGERERWFKCKDRKPHFNQISINLTLLLKNDIECKESQRGKAKSLLLKFYKSIKNLFLQFIKGHKFKENDKKKDKKIKLRILTPPHPNTQTHNTQISLNLALWATVYVTKAPAGKRPTCQWLNDAELNRYKLTSKHFIKCSVPQDGYLLADLGVFPLNSTRKWA